MISSSFLVSHEPHIAFMWGMPFEKLCSHELMNLKEMCHHWEKKRRVWNTVLTYYGTSGFIWNSIRNTKTEKEVRFYPLTSLLKSPSLFFHTLVL